MGVPFNVQLMAQVPSLGVAKKDVVALGRDETFNVETAGFALTIEHTGTT